MAKEFHKKTINRKENPGIQTAGQQDYSELIKTSLEQFSVTQSMQMAAFFTGKGTEAKTAQQAQAKAGQSQPSILGKSNSIYNTLESLRKSLSTSLSVKSQGIGGTVKSINDTIKDAFFDGNDALLYNINENLELLNREKINQVIDKLSIYEKTTEKLFELNKEIRENKEKEIAEAKLKIAIEGINDSTTDTLIKFSQLNLNKLEENSQSLINFFDALKVLENTKLNESLVNLNMLGPILVGFMAQIKVVNLIGKIVKPKDINNFSTILNSFCKIFVALNNLSALSGKSNAKQILKTFGVLQETLGLLVYSIPLFLIVNTSYASKNGNFGVNIGKTIEVLTDISVLFQYIIDMPQLNNAGKLLKSFGILAETLGLLVYSVPLFIAVNKMYASQNGNSGVNIGKTVEVLTDISVLFQYIIDMPQINNGGKLLKSFVIQKEFHLPHLPRLPLHHHQL